VKNMAQRATGTYISRWLCAVGLGILFGLFVGGAAMEMIRG
jgi:hypothetical protein